MNAAPVYPLSWEQVLERKDLLIGGDFESLRDDISFRGPIANIVFDGSTITIVCHWVAQTTKPNNQWVMLKRMNEFSITLNIEPFEGENGLIYFACDQIGWGFFYTSEGEKLNPSLVKGLINS
ncbi:MAG: hypothetical protein V4576_03380 [Patescibacteria group bacterium]